MIHTKNRFQYEAATGRSTLTVASFVALLSWAATSSHDWVNAGSLLSFGLATFLLMETDTRFALIRTRTALPASLFLLFYAAIPAWHPWSTECLMPALYICTLSALFRSYESAYASVTAFHAFLWVGISSLIVPCFIWMAPFFYIYMVSLRSFSPKTFFAGLIGLSLPYWFLLGYCLYTDQADTFFCYLTRLKEFVPIDYARLDASLFAAWGAVFLLYLTFGIFYLRQAYKDKVQTRIMLNGLLLMGIWTNLLMALQPQYADALLPLLMVTAAFMASHLFSLVFTRLTRILFNATLLLWMLLLAFSLWIHFSNS